MPARLAPDKSRGYLVPIGVSVRGTGETGIFKRLIALLVLGLGLPQEELS